MNWRLSFWKKLLANSHTHNVLRSGIHQYIYLYIYIYIFMPRTWGRLFFGCVGNPSVQVNIGGFPQANQPKMNGKKKGFVWLWFRTHGIAVVRSRAAMLACRVDVNTRTKNALERTLTLLYWHDNIVWGFGSFRFFRKHIAVAILECWVATGMFLIQYIHTYMFFYICKYLFTYISIHLHIYI